MAAQVTERPVLTCDPWTSKQFLFNWWVSLLHSCMVWELCLHYSCKFLSHLRKLKPASKHLAPFCQSEALIYISFHPNKFYKGSQLEEKFQISLLTTQKRPCIPLKQSDLSIFQANSRYFLIFFSWHHPHPSPSPSPPVPFHYTRWVIPLASFFLGGNFLVNFNQAPLRV